MLRSVQASDDQGGWTVSFAFWFCLLVSVVLFAIVSLSPKMLTYVQLRNQIYKNQVQLVALEENVRYLAKVKDALENDPKFAQELARVEFNAERPGDEVIPVAPELSLSAHRVTRQETATTPDSAQLVPWYTSLLQKISQQREIKQWLLISAAVMTVFAFTFLHEPEKQVVKRRNERKLAKKLV